jgi:hypothetical protein
VKRAWVEFEAEPFWSPVGAHDRLRRGPSGRILGWAPPAEWKPPLLPVAGKGYAHLYVEVAGMTFQFNSAYEARYCAEVLAMRLVPPRIADARWYRRLPARVKGRRARQEAAAYLRAACEQLDRQLPRIVASTGAGPARLLP